MKGFIGNLFSQKHHIMEQEVTQLTGKVCDVSGHSRICFHIVIGYWNALPQTGIITKQY